MSIMWVIFGHIASQVAFQLANFTEFYSFLMSGDYMALYSATVSVDSFFLIGGLLTAYLGTVGWKKATDSGFLASIKAFVLFLLNRYARLTPVLAFGIWCTMAFVPLFGDGALIGLRLEILLYLILVIVISDIPKLGIS